MYTRLWTRLGALLTPSGSCGPPLGSVGPPCALVGPPWAFVGLLGSLWAWALIWADTSCASHGHDGPPGARRGVLGGHLGPHFGPVLCSVLASKIKNPRDPGNLSPGPGDFSREVREVGVDFSPEEKNPQTLQMVIFWEKHSSWVPEKNPGTFCQNPLGGEKNPLKIH